MPDGISAECALFSLPPALPCGLTDVYSLTGRTDDRDKLYEQQ